jgi:nucleoside-diphosphate-sugar epimerase
MIIGSGMLAKAFAPKFNVSPNIWIYAAGVSNSGCTNPMEFERERLRLLDSLKAGMHAEAFVYFSTCSILDPHATSSAYVRHKIDMERLVSKHPNFIVVRLPNVAGFTPNPHTLLNFLYARVSRSESFVIWKNASRNIIDIDDVVAILANILEDPQLRRISVNVANPVSHPVTDIVAAMERVAGKPAVTEIVNDGAAFEIDISLINPIINKLGLPFDTGYLSRVLEKYYGQTRDK